MGRVASLVRWNSPVVGWEEEIQHFGKNGTVPTHFRRGMRRHHKGVEPTGPRIDSRTSIYANLPIGSYSFEHPFFPPRGIPEAVLRSLLHVVLSDGFVRSFLSHRIAPPSPSLRLHVVGSRRTCAFPPTRSHRSHLGVGFEDLVGRSTWTGGPSRTRLGQAGGKGGRATVARSPSLLIGGEGANRSGLHQSPCVGDLPGFTPDILPMEPPSPFQGFLSSLPFVPFERHVESPNSQARDPIQAP